MTHKLLEDRRPGLQPPRFGLGTLMSGVTLLAVCFALFSYLGSHATALVILFALAVIAHIAGNALGTRLRDNGSTPVNENGELLALSARCKAKTSEFAPATQLREKVALGRTILIVTLVGTLLGGVLGGLGFALISAQPASVAGIAFGAIAASILGGIWTFIAASFIQVAAGAAWQAMRDRQ